MKAEVDGVGHLLHNVTAISNIGTTITDLLELAFQDWFDANRSDGPIDGGMFLPAVQLAIRLKRRSTLHVVKHPLQSSLGYIRAPHPSPPKDLFLFSTTPQATMPIGKGSSFFNRMKMVSS